MIDFRSHLNSEQHDVVMTEGGPILVIAGAGSGKTRTLTYRVARLLESGVPEDAVLLATFTNKAARSMLGRVEALTGRALRDLWGGTFHHLANKTLRRHAPLLGYERNFTILDESDARHLLQTCVKEAGLSKCDHLPTPGLLGDIISLAVNTGGAVEDVVMRRFPAFFSYISEILHIELRYRVRKKELNCMDFDDLLDKWRELLRDNAAVRDEYTERFLHVLVDEYQDTNRIQAEILDIIASRHRNIMVVGDDSQSIYSFRGADFLNILHFPEKYPDARIFKLETNYRSTPEILHLANMSIINNRDQFQKELRAVRKRGGRPVFVPLRDVMQQADFVSQRIIELADEGVPLNDIAVLYRAHYHSMEVQMELVRRRIPFEIRSGIRFFEQAHIKDVTAFLRLLVNPFDEVAWKRVLMLYRKIGTVTADRVWKNLISRNDPISCLLDESFLDTVPGVARPALCTFRDLIGKLLQGPRRDDPAGLIGLIRSGGYDEFIETRYGTEESRKEDLQQLALFSERYDSLTDFLSELSLLTNITEESDQITLRNGDERVILSSIHQAKGLEWSVVFMIWCSEGKIPLARAMKEPGGVDEERRLFYVATTRAKDRLYLCSTLLDHDRGAGNRVLAPSRFIHELAPAYCDPEELPFEQWIIGEY
ncbi:MAG: ATP-dependent helicase [Deltaproteobacteria bacterium]|nr:ATP-dependent helicase [Deltaproteobacteria bacterium]